MKPVRNLVSDLVEKRLWPFALLLVVAIVAIPILLGGGESTPVPAADIPAAPAERSSDTVQDVALVGPPSVARRAGAERNPFRRPAAAKVATSAPTTASDSAPAAGASSASADDPTASEDDPTANPVETEPVPAPAPAEPAAPADKPYYWSTSVRFDDIGDTDTKKRTISRLTPLGGVDDTALVYLGVGGDHGQYAVFVLGPTATSTGEGGCEDAKCRIIGLKKGESQIVSVKTDKGQTRRYELEVVSIDKKEVDSAAEARRARLRVHPDGREVLRSMIQDRPTAAALAPISYIDELGMVASAKPAVDKVTP